MHRNRGVSAEELGSAVEDSLYWLATIVGSPTTPSTSSTSRAAPVRKGVKRHSKKGKMEVGKVTMGGRYGNQGQEENLRYMGHPGYTGI